MSDGMLAHARTHAERLVAERKLDASSLVVEIASNDGYLLQYYKAAGIPVLGIEPAANVAKVAESERGIPTLVEFFDASLGQKLANEGRRANVIHANNVFAHVPDPVSFLRGIVALLAPGGIASIEAPYVKEMLDKVEFDTIYHEHLFYYSLTAISRLCTQAELVVVDVERLPIHGGSLRCVLARPGEVTPTAHVAALLGEESAWGVDKPENLSFVRGKGRDFAREPPCMAEQRQATRAPRGGLWRFCKGDHIVELLRHWPGDARFRGRSQPI